MTNKPNVLLLADTTHPTSAVGDHIHAITSGQDIHWHVVNPLIIKTIDKMDLSPFDALGVHYSAKPYNNYYLSSSLKRKIADYKGIKFLFLQDEYQRVNEVQEFIFRSGFNLLFTLVEERFLEKAYPDPRLKKLKKVRVLTAYVTDEMKQWSSVPVADRSIDVSYRGRHYDYWLGSLTYEKVLIAEQFIQRTKNYNLKLDISLEESQRVYGTKWLDLLKNSRAVLGTESGTSIWDFDRSIEKMTINYLKKNKQATFDEVYKHVLQPYDGNIIYSAISPRIFEAAATKTPMIMFPGDYSGVCVPDKHYILLKKDFSNLDEVLIKLKDTEYLQALADKTFDDLIVSDKYSQYEFSKTISHELTKLLTHKKNYSASDKVAAHLQHYQDRYKLVNAIRRLATESYFVGEKFWGLLTDPKVSWAERTRGLFKGVKRYMVYLLARFN